MLASNTMKNIVAPQAGVATSADGTRIAWTRQGDGPAVVMVAGVMASRARPQQPGVAEALAAHATVLTYDRRGTGESGDASGYDVRRELEDLRCVLDLAGPDATVYGFSSGATLALIAAEAGLPIARLVLVEPPLVPDPDLGPLEEARRRLAADPADARRWFDAEVTGIPAEVRAQFPPLTQEHLDDAPSMLHELTFLPGTTAERFRDATAPALLLASDHTSPYLLDGVHALAAALPQATERILPSQWHGLPVETLVAAVASQLRAGAA